MELKNIGKKIIANGLDMTYEAKPFGQIGNLMAIADDVTKLHAVCTSCGEDALYNQRLLNGEPVPLGKTIKTGDKDADENGYSYSARCQHCFVNPTKVILKK